MLDRPSPVGGVLNFHWIIAVLGVFYAFYLTDSIGLGITDRARLCFAFNEYALSMLDGRLDVPALAIGLEGKFTNDGKVYTYYGALPAILRMPLAPFVDLSETCVAKQFMFVYAVVIGFVCHITALKIGRAAGIAANERHQFFTALFLCLVWFASPLTILMSSAAQTYEPIALGLLLTVMFLGIIAYEVIVEKRHSPKRIISLSIIAALCVHARPHIAVLLYAVVFFACLLLLLHFRQGDGSWYSRLEVNRSAVGRVTVAIIVLSLSGLSIISMNYARWERFGFSMPQSIGQYGFFKFVEPYDSPRRVSAREHKLGTFSVRRVPSNAVFHTVGGWETRLKLLDYFGAGHVRIAKPYSLTALMWLPWYLGLFYLLFRARSILRWLGPRSAYAASAWIASAGIAYLILAYVTSTYRYKVEIWPLLYCSGLFLFGWQMFKPEQPEKIISKGRKAVVFGMLVGVSLLAAVYSFQQYRLKSEIAFDHGMFPEVECVWSREDGWSEDCAKLPE